MKRLLFSLLASASLLTAACQKDSDDQPQPVAPVQEASLNTTFRYYSPDETRGINNLAQQPAGQLLSDRLTLTLANDNAFPKERLEFVLPKTKQLAGLVGTYALASQPDPGQGAVQTHYQRVLSPESNVVDSNFNRISGSLIITTYDARRQLISGSYLIEAANVKDFFTFTAVSGPNDSRRSGDLRVYGTFTEVPLR